MNFSRLKIIFLSYSNEYVFAQITSLYQKTSQVVNGPQRVPVSKMIRIGKTREARKGNGLKREDLLMSNIMFKIVLSSTICIAIIPSLCTLMILLSCSSDQQCFNVLWQMVTKNFARISKATQIISTKVDCKDSLNQLVQLVEINQTNHDHTEGLHKSSNSDRSCILSDDCPDINDDRILTQLRLTQQTDKIFKILPPDFSFPEGQEVFYRDSCNINRCVITYEREEADLLVFSNSDVFVEPRIKKREEQIWVAYFLESPIHTFDKRFKRLHRGSHIFNWTASYRSDSDIVTPYSKFVLYGNVKVNHSVDYMIDQVEADKYYNESCPDKHRKLIEGKKGKIAWFASNCNAANNRLEYAKELSKYIPIDIYGKCGNLTCDKWNQTGCFDIINKNYKFYLAFENSNCHEYITEKLYKNSFGHNDLNYLVIPIVMGAPKEDYVKLAPPNSFIHVDDFESAKHLADYLQFLDHNNQLYYTYFRWKKLGHFIETKFMCRICAIVHNSFISGKKKSYTNISEWWNKYKLPSGERGIVNSCYN